MSIYSDGQFLKTRKKLTAEELDAVQRISGIFTKRINATGDISSLIDELFVSNFIERLIKEKKNEISRKAKKYRSESFDPNKVTFVSSLDFKSELLDQSPPDEWKRLYISTFNLKHFQTILYLNNFISLENSGRKYDCEKLFQTETLFPLKILELFDRHPNLKGFLRLKINSEPVKTIEELQSVNTTLEEGWKILNEEKNGMPAIEISEEVKKVQAKLKVKPHSDPVIEINSEDFFGFMAGTRFIIVWIPPGYKLFIIKLKGDYKIILKP